MIVSSAIEIAPRGATTKIDLDAAIADARQQLAGLSERRKQLKGVIRSFTNLKKRQMPSELFGVEK